MNAGKVPIMGAAIQIPDDIAARAEAVPGLSERVVNYIRMEVARHEERQRRFSPETLALVERARQTAEVRRAEGYNREAAMAGFEERYRRLTEAEPS